MLVWLVLGPKIGTKPQSLGQPIGNAALSCYPCTQYAQPAIESVLPGAWGSISSHQTSGSDFNGDMTNGYDSHSNCDNSNDTEGGHTENKQLAAFAVK